METTIPMLLAVVVGFGHAFEADHLVAVSNIVTKRNKLSLALKDGIFWGLGHTSTILLIGVLLIIGKATFLDGYFGYLEAFVGVMLVGLGVFRLYKYYRPSNETDHHHAAEKNHRLAYGVGLVHGIAGSGALILIVMAEFQSSLQSIIYLVLFGLGSVVGMLIAAGVFNLPFSKRVNANSKVRKILILASSYLCIGYGIYVIIENLS